MSHYKKLAKETLVYGLGTIVPRFLNFVILTPYYTRLLSQFEYGVFTEVYAYGVILNIILTYGTETGYFKFATDKGQNEKTVYDNILTCLLITSAIFVISVNLLMANVAKSIDFGGKTVYLSLFSFILFFDTLSAIPFAKLRLQKRIIKFSALKIINVVINVGSVILFLSVLPVLSEKYGWLKNYYNHENRLMYVFIANLAASLITLVLLGKEIGSLKLRLDRGLLKKILSYSWPLLIAGMFGALNDSLDRILLKTLLPEEMDAYQLLGIYGANFKMAVIITLFVQMYRFAAEPYFFSIQKEYGSKTVYANIMRYLLIVCLFVFLLVTLYIDIFKYYIGPGFRSGLYLVPIIMLANVEYGVLLNLNFWYKLSNKTKYAINIVGFGAVLTVIANVILVPRFNILGCAWARVVAYSGMIVYSYILENKYYKINYNKGKLLFYCIVTLVIFIIGYYINYKTVFIKIAINSGLLLLFVFIVEKKEKLVKSFVKR